MDPEAAGQALRERIGIVLQEAGIDAELTVTEVLRLYASFYLHPREVEDAIALVGLEGKRRARVKTLSGGQRRRLDLALGLIGDPDLIFLDEPTTGFDPSARRDAWRLIERLRALGRTIFLTTHYMDEVQHLADRVVVMSGGRIIAQGTPTSLGHERPEVEISFRLPSGTDVAQLPPRLRGLVECRDGHASLRTTEPTTVLHELTSWALARGDGELDGLQVVRPSLEDVYLQLMAEQAGEHGAESGAHEAVGTGDGLD